MVIMLTHTIQPMKYTASGQSVNTTGQIKRRHENVNNPVHPIFFDGFQDEQKIKQVWHQVGPHVHLKVSIKVNSDIFGR